MKKNYLKDMIIGNFLFLAIYFVATLASIPQGYKIRKLNITEPELSYYTKRMVEMDKEELIELNSKCMLLLQAKDKCVTSSFLMSIILSGGVVLFEILNLIYLFKLRKQ